MRLIATPSFRAFPELDEFSDEQCRAFVQATRRMLGARIATWAFRLFVTFAVPPIVVFAVAYLHGPPAPGRSIDLIAVLLIAGVAWMGFGWLVAKDLALRWLIHRVMRRGGSCMGCGYRLVGLSVGPDAVVTCPECGHALDLTAFPQCRVATAGGVERFLPGPGFVAERPPFWTPARRRALGRLAVVVALVVAIPSVAWIAFAAYETRRASSDLASLPTARQLCDAIAPAGALPAACNAFDVHRLVQPQGAIGTAEGRVLSVLLRANFEARFVRWGVPLTAAVPGGGVPIEAQYADRLAEIDGFDQDMAMRGGLAPFMGCVRSPLMRPEPHARLVRGVPGVLDSIPMSCGAQLRALACLTALAATRSGDGGVLAEAIELLLAVARVDRWSLAGPAWPSDGITSIELVPLVASAIRARGEPFAAEIDAAIARQADGPVPSAMARARLGFYRVVLCERYQSTFEERAFPWGRERSFVVFRQSYVQGRGPWLCTYGASRAALDTAGAVALREALKEPSERDDAAFAAAVLELQSSGVGIGFAGVSIHNGTMFADRELVFARVLATVVAIERFRLAEGRLPDRLEELVPRWLPALPKDPYSRGAFRYAKGAEDRTCGFGYSLARSLPAGAEGSGEPADPGSPLAGAAVFPPN